MNQSISAKMEIWRFALAASIAALMPGCSDATTSSVETTQTQLVSECETPVPDEYSECLLVEDDPENPILSIDESQGWREASRPEIGGHRVDIDVTRINAGLLPEDAEQGYYGGIEEFHGRLSFLLGVEVGSDEGQASFGTIGQVGDTVKYVGDPGDAQEFGGNTSGDFICDAITNSAGEIWIEGEMVSNACPSVFRLNYEVDSDGEYSSSSDVTTTVSAIRISAQNEAADLVASSWSFFGFYAEIGSRISNYSVNGKSSKWVYDPWGGFWPRWRKLVAKPGSMELANRYYNNNRFVASPGDLLFSTSKWKSGVASMSLKEWWVGTGICIDDFGKKSSCGPVDSGPVNTVCTRGRAGQAEGTTGTNARCPDLF